LIDRYSFPTRGRFCLLLTPQFIEVINKKAVLSGAEPRQMKLQNQFCSVINVRFGDMCGESNNDKSRRSEIWGAYGGGASPRHKALSAPPTSALNFCLEKERSSSPIKIGLELLLE
jgi:hypothetical protein